MSNGGLAKAIIVKIDQGGQEVEAPIKVMFNPKELTFDKQVNWNMNHSPGADLPVPEFGGGGPATLRLQLLFDTYTEQKDVRKVYTDRIYKLMWVEERSKDSKNKKGRPPAVRFQWGKVIGFDAVITSISQRFTLFLPDGVPVRAMLDVAFSQVRDSLFYPPQNPTSGGKGGETVWEVKPGDTLASIAFSRYHDAGKWRSIADANQLESVRDLSPGTQLLIPRI